MTSNKGVTARHRHYVDWAVQGRLLLVLILLELALFGIAMLLAYVELEGVIEANLYRVHRPEPGSQPLLLESLLPLVVGIFLANLVVVLLATRFWGRYVDAIVRPLKALFGRVASLDLREVSLQPERHEVLALGQHWLARERERCLAIREVVDALSAAGQRERVESDAALRQGLERLRARLPDFER